MKAFQFKINGNTYKVAIHALEEGMASLEVNGTAYQVELEMKTPLSKTPKLVRAKTPQHTGVHHPMTTTARVSVICAPLPGTILSVEVREGDTVQPEQLVLMMEAMKMENRVLAETGGTVKLVKIKPGDSVLQGEVLIELG